MTYKYFASMKKELHFQVYFYSHPINMRIQVN